MKYNMLTVLRNEFFIRIFNLLLLPDYDTNKTVQCVSSYIYDEQRQRSLQHFITFENLVTKDKTVILPSGKFKSIDLFPY